MKAIRYILGQFKVNSGHFLGKINQKQSKANMMTGLNNVSIQTNNPILVNESTRFNLTNTSVAHAGRGKQHHDTSSCAVPQPTTGDLKAKSNSRVALGEGK